MASVITAFAHLVMASVMACEQGSLVHPAPVAAGSCDTTPRWPSRFSRTPAPCSLVCPPRAAGELCSCCLAGCEKGKPSSERQALLVPAMQHTRLLRRLPQLADLAHVPCLPCSPVCGREERDCAAHHFLVHLHSLVQVGQGIVWKLMRFRAENVEWACTRRCIVRIKRTRLRPAGAR